MLDVLKTIQSSDAVLSRAVMFGPNAGMKTVEVYISALPYRSTLLACFGFISTHCVVLYFEGGKKKKNHGKQLITFNHPAMEEPQVFQFYGQQYGFFFFSMDSF